MLYNTVIIKQGRKEETWYATSNQLSIIKILFFINKFNI